MSSDLSKPFAIYPGRVPSTHTGGENRMSHGHHRLQHGRYPPGTQVHGAASEPTPTETTSFPSY